MPSRLTLSLALAVICSCDRLNQAPDDPRPVAQVQAAPPPAAAAPPTAQPATTNPELPSITGLVEAVKGAVINVEVTARTQAPAITSPFEGFDPGNDFWERFFGRGFPAPRAEPRERLRQGIGSGFLISPDGLALTNNHVIQGAVSIRVRLDDQRTFNAEVLGRDPLTDVALIKLQGEVKDLPHVKLGDSDALRVGEWVVAIGNPFGLASSVSAGIVSAQKRNIGAGPYDDFLQTDAAINPGNSGGPLFNLQGEVVGINTAIIGGGSGIGFAVPSNLVKALLPQLQEEGSVSRGWLGITVQDLTAELARGLEVPVTEGALVADFSKPSPAAEAGLKVDDVIVSVDGEEITSAGELTRKVGLKRPESNITLGVHRGAKKLELQVKLGTRPDLEGAQASAPADQRRSEAEPSRLGLMLQDISPQIAAQRNMPVGAYVADVRPGSAADRAQLRPGMVIVEVNQKPVHSVSELQRALRGLKPGDVALLRVQLGESRLLRALTIPNA